MSDEFDWVNRDRGILTKRDREILVNKFDVGITKNAKNQRRYNIRNRVQNAIYDFEILAQHLPHGDIQQIFSPAYDWSVERRKLDEQGRTHSWPEFTEFLQSWLSLFELFAYGMYAGGKTETGELLQLLIQQGLQRGARNIQHTRRDIFRDVDASIAIETDNERLWQNFIAEVESNLPDDPTAAAEEILRLHQSRKIPPDVARQWIQHHVHGPRPGNTDYR